MFTMTRLTQIMTVLILACGLFISVCRGETATAYSGRYATDLEQKQMLLESIKEDANVTENAVRQESEKAKTSNSQGVSCLGFDKIDLAEIMPHSEKIHVAFINMNGTLSPRPGQDCLSQYKDRSRE